MQLKKRLAKNKASMSLWILPPPCWGQPLAPKVQRLAVPVVWAPDLASSPLHQSGSTQMKGLSQARLDTITPETKTAPRFGRSLFPPCSYRLPLQAPTSCLEVVHHPQQRAVALPQRSPVFGCQWSAAAGAGQARSDAVAAWARTHFFQVAAAAADSRGAEWRGWGGVEWRRGGGECECACEC